VCGIRRLKTGPESCESKFISVRPNKLSDRSKMLIFLEIVHQGLSCKLFFRFSVFSVFHGPVQN